MHVCKCKSHLCTLNLCVSDCMLRWFRCASEWDYIKLLSSDRENATWTKRQKCSTICHHLFAMVIRQANLLWFACYCCLLVCLYFSHKMAVYHLDSFALDSENPAPGHHQVSLFGLWSERGISWCIQKLIEASFNPNIVLQTVVPGLYWFNNLGWMRNNGFGMHVCACVWSHLVYFCVPLQKWAEYLCGCTHASIVYEWCKHHCLMSFCTDHFSSMLCSYSCIFCWKWGQHASNPLLLSYSCSKKGKKETGWHITVTSTCNFFK